MNRVDKIIANFQALDKMKEFEGLGTEVGERIKLVCALAIKAATEYDYNTVGVFLTRSIQFTFRHKKTVFPYDIEKYIELLALNVEILMEAIAEKMRYIDPPDILEAEAKE